MQVEWVYLTVFGTTQINADKTQINADSFRNNQRLIRKYPRSNEPSEVHPWRTR